MRSRAVARRALALVILAPAVLGATRVDHPIVSSLLTDASVRAALDLAKANEPQTIADQIRFCEVAAPPFKEAARAEILRRTFQQLGLQNVRVDRAGNVLGDRPGVSARPRLVIAAHLDTVFPEGTDLTVKRRQGTLRGPGIGDNCRGLAVLVAVIRALGRAGVRTPASITFAADVGEEGLGDLRGMKQLFNETMKGGIDRFVAIDGPGLSITNVAVGSRRFRVTFKGPGGHSFASFGVANPINALGRAVATIADFQTSRWPRVTFNVGRIGGGTSVNAIPQEGWMEVDLRSADSASLRSIEASFQTAVDRAAAEENERWGTPGVITVAKELIGDRPAGATPEGAPIVQTALAVGRALGLSGNLGEGSTDANFPINLKIPAIAIGAGGRGLGIHTLGESFDPADSWLGTQRAVLLTVALAQDRL